MDQQAAELTRSFGAVLRCGSLLSALILVALAACASTATTPGGNADVSGAGGGLGDVNCDQQINPVDAALILQLDAGLIQQLACPQNADVNGDGRTNAVDASLVLQYVAGIIDHLSGPVSTATPTPAATPVATPLTCGVERWPVKTLSDSDAALVDFTPVASTVADLRAIPAPSSLPQNSRIAPTELTTYSVTANLVEFKLEDDRDIHLVIADQTDASQTMIVEFPDASVCAGAVDSAHAAEMRTARAALVAAVGQPSASHFTNLTGTGTVTGVGFFDFQHGQTGVAPNGIELHPVLAFSTAQSGPTATPVQSTPTPIPTAPASACHTDAAANPWGYDFCSPGSFIYSPPSDFCSYFSCIASFWNGNGYVMECNDGMFGKSGRISGSCSRHGGNWRPLYSH